MRTSPRHTERTVRVRLNPYGKLTRGAVVLSTFAALTFAGAAGATGPVGPDAPGTGRLTPCQYEDSNGCVWDAVHAGNGDGRSFVVTPAGKFIPVPHYVAHALVFGSYGEGSPRVTR